ncbi:MAG TPA: hypothetical protein DEP66_03170 [Acidimicrobiaceae bacterium]|nr:hypothetical protein [Acidimicrobiaceae bacterium]
MQIFGVVNAAPDSAAKFTIVADAAAARLRGAALLAAGAEGIDIGAEGSTGSAADVDAESEWARLAEPLAGVVSLGVDVSVDTRHASVAERALDAGATVLNAGDALQSEAMVRLAAEREVRVVLPFMLGPDFRSLRHVVGDPVPVIVDWFETQLRRLRPRGVVERLLLDPGVGFAPHGWNWPDRYEYQKAVSAGLGELRRFGLPLYVPVAWKQAPDRLELIDLALAHNPEFVRAHIPSQVRARHAALVAGTPLPTDRLTTATV